MTLLGFIACRPLLSPCQYLRVEKRELTEEEDVVELGEICRVLSRVCATVEAAELAWETLALSGEELSEVSREAPFKPRVATESFVRPPFGQGRTWRCRRNWAGVSSRRSGALPPYDQLGIRAVT
jgi:hypothetical protein